MPCLWCEPRLITTETFEVVDACGRYVRTYVEALLCFSPLAPNVGLSDVSDFISPGTESRSSGFTDES